MRSKIRLIVIFVLLFFVSKSSFGQTGCYIASENTIYTVNTGTDYVVWYWFWPITYRVYSNPVPTNAPSCPRAQLGSSTGNSCMRSPGSAGITGTVYNYTMLNPPTQCDFDNFTPVLVLGFAGIGIFIIRRRPLKINRKDNG